MGAVLYDSLLLFAVLLFATIPVLAITGGEAIDPGNSIFRAYVLLISFLYFIVPWKLKGQTLGMQSWKIKLGPGSYAYSVFQLVLDNSWPGFFLESF